MICIFSFFTFYFLEGPPFICIDQGRGIHPITYCYVYFLGGWLTPHSYGLFRGRGNGQHHTPTPSEDDALIIRRTFGGSERGEPPAHLPPVRSSLDQVQTKFRQRLSQVQTGIRSSLDKVYITFGLCLDHASDHVLNMFGPRIDHVWTKFIQCLDHVQTMF